MGTTTHHQSVIYSALFLLLAPAATATAERCHPDDKKVLLRIQKHFTVNIFTSTFADCCKWGVVTCDPITNRITFFGAYASSLAGTIPPCHRRPHLPQNPRHPQAPEHHRPHPRLPRQPRHLEFLRLDWNGLTGPIPDVLHTLNNLSYVNLSFNKLSGSIPPSLALGPSLDYLRLDRNRLTGFIPDNFGSIKNGEIYSLHLSYNQLSGPIPTSLGNLNFTNILDLSRNMLTGDASFLFGRSKSVNVMDLSRNQLAFDFSKVEIPSEIGSLMLDHNKMYGGLPASLTGLASFNVSYNRLCGKIPAGVGNKSDKYSFFHNKCLCGAPLDPCK